MLVLACALGGSPREFDEDAEVAVEFNRREVKPRRSPGALAAPRQLAPLAQSPGFLQGLMAAGAPMDLSLPPRTDPGRRGRAHAGVAEGALRVGASSLSMRKGKSLSSEAEIALEDVMRLRDEVQRGRERLFHASLSLTLHAPDEESLAEITQTAKAHFASTLGKLDALPFRQREGRLSTLPLGLNAVAAWRTLDTTSLAFLYPFSPPDLDTRGGDLRGIDLRASSPVVYDPWDGTHLNANTAVLARSGSGKSFATKLGVLRGLCRGRGRLRDRPRGRVRRHGPRRRRPRALPGRGRPGHEPLRDRPRRPRGAAAAHRQPPAADRGDGRGAARRRAPGRARPRPRRLLRAAAASAAASPTSSPTSRTTPEGDAALARLLRPFATGSLRHLLTDEGDDLLANEALVTVFDLHLLEPELRPAATMVCTETVWAAAARDPRPRLLVVDEVWSIMQHPEGAAFMVSMAKRARKHRLGLQFITQDVQDLLSRGLLPRHHRPQRGAPSSRTPPSSSCSSRTPPPSAPSATPSTCPRTCSAGSCHAPAAMGSCSHAATASRSASRRRPRRPSWSSGGPARSGGEEHASRVSRGRASTPPNQRNTQTTKGTSPMRLNPFHQSTPAEPVLLAITPPRTGVRTLLGVENLLGVDRRARALLARAHGRRLRRHAHGALPRRPGRAPPARRALPAGGHP